MGLDSRFRNILILGIGFMFMMAAWIAMAGIEQTILKSIQLEDPTFTGDGFISMSIVSVVYAFSNFVAPIMLAYVGVRTTMIVGTLLYAIFIATFLFPNIWLLYSTSALVGFAMAIVWVGNGNYFTRCSTKDNIGLNFGIFWCTLATGETLGTAFIFWKFQGKNHIDEGTRRMVIYVLAGVALLGAVTLCFLGKPGANADGSDTESIDSVNVKKEKKRPNFWSTLIAPFRLFKEKHMLLLIPSIFYNGYQNAFFSGIYPTSVGFSEAFGGDVKKLVGLAGVLSGLGSLAAGIIFGLLGERVFPLKRKTKMIIACAGHCTCFILAYLNLPNGAPLGPTDNVSWINPPSIPIAMLCAFLLGAGDGLVSPQVGSAVGVIWPDNASAAFAVYRFIHGFIGAGAFFLSFLTGLYNQLIIFGIVAVVGTITFCLNEKLIEKKEYV